MLEILGYNQCFFSSWANFHKVGQKHLEFFCVNFLKHEETIEIFLPIFQNQKIGGKKNFKRGYNKQNKHVIKYCTKNLTPYKYHSCKWYQIELSSVE